MNSHNATGPTLTDAQRQRFEQDLPAWLAGALDAPDAQWMEALQHQHPTLQAQTQALRQVRAVLRDAATEESTDAAWDLLMQKVAADAAAAPATTASPTRTQPPRWLAWLWGHADWANACAAAAVVALVAPTAWMAWQHQPAPDNAGPAWRSSPLERLQAAAPADVRVRLEVQLQPDAPATALAELSAITGPQLAAIWQAQDGHRWVLQLTPPVPDTAALLQALQAHPAVVAARWLPALDAATHP
ncbi:MAG: hypothetical protein RR100_04660 [Comamonas sp.]